MEVRAKCSQNPKVLDGAAILETLRESEYLSYCIGMQWMEGGFGAVFRLLEQSYMHNGYNLFY